MKNRQMSTKTRYFEKKDSLLESDLLLQWHVNNAIQVVKRHNSTPEDDTNRTAKVRHVGSGSFLKSPSLI